MEQLAFLGELLHVRLKASGTDLEMVCLPHEAGRLKVGQGVSLNAAPEQVILLAE